MEYFSDIFLGAGAIAAAVYCLVLSRKLSKLKGLDQDLGGAIAVLSSQVDDMTRALETAQKSADTSSAELSEFAERAEAASSKLELLFASLHDLPDLSSAGVTSASRTSVASELVGAERPLFARRARSNGAGKGP